MLTATYDSSTLFTTFTVLSSAVAVASAVTGTIAHASLDAQTFAFTYMPSPTVSNIEPSYGAVYTNNEVTLTMVDFPFFDTAADVRLSVGGEIVYLLNDDISYSPDQQILTFKTPKATAVDVADVIVTHIGAFASLIPATSSFTFEPRDPKLLTVKIDGVLSQQGSMEGGTRIEIEIEAFEQLASASDVVAQFAGLGYASVAELYWSDSSSTKLAIISPVALGPGSVIVELIADTTTTFFEYTYVNPLITSTLLTAASGPTVGGTTVTFQVQNFPELAISDLIVQFGGTTGVVQSVSGGATKEITILTSVVPSGVTYNEGKAVVTCKILQAADGELLVAFPFVYQKPLEVTTAVFADAYTRIVLTFDQPADGGGNGAVVNCTSVFTVSTALMFGSHSTCSWPSESVLEVTLDSDFTLSPTDNVMFVSTPMPLGVSINVTSLALATTEIELEDDQSTLPPTAFVYGLTTLGVCEAMSLDGGSSVGTRLDYYWSCDNDAVLNAIISAQRSSSVFVDPELLSDITQFSISLVVKDWMGRVSAPAYFTVDKSDLAIPQISIVGPSYIRRDITAQINVNAQATFSSCADEGAIAYEWSQDTGDAHILTNGDPSAGIDGDFTGLGASMIIPADVLQMGQEYTFYVVAYPEADAKSRGSASITIYAKAPDLEAIVTGGSGVRTLTRDLVLNGTLSNDPTASETLNYRWSCAQQSNGLDCRKADNSLLIMEEAAAVTVPANILVEGSYLFTLEIFTATRYDYVTETITMMATVAPDVSMVMSLPTDMPEVSLDPIMFPAFGGIRVPQVNVESRVYLVAAAEQFTQTYINDTISSSGVTWTYTVTPFAQFDNSVSPNTLIFTANSLTAGQVYTVRATATPNPINLVDPVTNVTTVIQNDAGYAEFVFGVNNPPSSGDCNVYEFDPSYDGVSAKTVISTGNSFSTEFEIVCTNWRDAEDVELLYTFGKDKLNEGTGEFSVQIFNYQTNGLSNKVSLPPLEAGTFRFSVNIVDLQGSTVTWTTDIEVVEVTITADEALNLLDDQMNLGSTSDALSIIMGLAGSDAFFGFTRRRMLETQESEVAVLGTLQLTHYVETIMNSTILDVSLGNVGNAVLTLASLTAAAGLSDTQLQATINKTVPLMTVGVTCTTAWV